MLKVTIIYGNLRAETTYNFVKIIKSSLMKKEEYEFNEIYLPADLKSFCFGCFNCFLKGEERCPHYEEVSVMVNKILDCDGIIMASPVYGMNISSAMKNFIDHTCYLWMPHRPRKEMFSKIGFIVSSTAGAGTGNTLKAMKYPMNYWGVNRIIQFGQAVRSSNWHDVKDKTKIEKNISRKSEKFHKLLKKRDSLKSRVYTKALFYIMRKLVNKVYEEDADKAYWRQNGWLKENTPLK